MHEAKSNKFKWLFSWFFEVLVKTGKVPTILHKCEEFTNRQLFEGRHSVKKNTVIAYIFNGQRLPFWNVRLIVQCYAPRTLGTPERDCRTPLYHKTNLLAIYARTNAALERDQQERKLFARFTRSAKSPCLNMTLGVFYLPLRPLRKFPFFLTRRGHVTSPRQKERLSGPLRFRRLRGMSYSERRSHVVQICTIMVQILQIWQSYTKRVSAM